MTRTRHSAPAALAALISAAALSPRPAGAQAEQALQRGDRQGVRQALQQARQAMRGDGGDMIGSPGGTR